MTDILKSRCYYETPHDVANEFAHFVSRFMQSTKHNLFLKKKISVLDIFAGDGRLGNTISEVALKKNVNINLTFVEIDNEKIGLISPEDPNSRIICADAFSWNAKKKYDIIVTNPPFDNLNINKSKTLGFLWDDVKRAGKNTYGLSILRCLELCEAGGMVAAIAPFNWISGVNSEILYDQLLNICEKIHISAFNHRHIFRNVLQDIGFQIFRKKQIENNTKSKIYFSYNGFKNKSIKKTVFKDTHDDKSIKVRVGTIVWNRKKEFLKSTDINGIALIYGGNIDHNGVLVLKNEKYANRQFIQKSGITDQDIIAKPAILIRRTLRGSPGNWKIDSCLLNGDLRYVTENHIIVIELLSNRFNHTKFHKSLISQINEYYYNSGSPNLSTKMVSKIANQLISQV